MSKDMANRHPNEAPIHRIYRMQRTAERKRRPAHPKFQERLQQRWDEEIKIVADRFAALGSLSTFVQGEAERLGIKKGGLKGVANEIRTQHT